MFATCKHTMSYKQLGSGNTGAMEMMRKLDGVTRRGSGTGRMEPISIGREGFDKDHFVIPAHYTHDIDRVLIPHGMIEDRIEKLAYDVKRRFRDELHVLCVLKGSRWFFGRLLSFLNKIHIYACPESTAPPYMEHYVRLKSYDGDSSTGNLQVICEDLSILKGKQVLIVEDIIDTGHTLTKFCKWMEALEPESISVASLLEKRTEKSNGFKGDFVGFSVPDAFVVGFSLDYNEMYRDLEHVCVLTKAAQVRGKSNSTIPPPPPPIASPPLEEEEEEE
eukprot:GHVS01018737.1.p1 GENE.GHVS01018737.1~~GHVS01018737.1.p1  ORF type:complete len:277 (+),score=52.23 GHVS01018737.1:2-832(+)